MPVQARRDGETLFVDNVDLKRGARNLLKKTTGPGWRPPADINEAMEQFAALLGYANLLAANDQATTTKGLLVNGQDEPPAVGFNETLGWEDRLAAMAPGDIAIAELIAEASHQQSGLLLDAPIPAIESAVAQLRAAGARVAVADAQGRFLQFNGGVLAGDVGVDEIVSKLKRMDPEIVVWLNVDAVPVMSDSRALISQALDGGVALVLHTADAGQWGMSIRKARGVIEAASVSRGQKTSVTIKGQAVAATASGNPIGRAERPEVGMGYRVFLRREHVDLPPPQLPLEAVGHATWASYNVRSPSEGWQERLAALAPPASGLATAIADASHKSAALLLQANSKDVATAVEQLQAAGARVARVDTSESGQLGYQAGPYLAASWNSGSGPTIDSLMNLNSDVVV